MTIEFAHPVERALAHVFDEHGIAWRYEPHTFVLERDADGVVRRALTPDFFLPELGIYVECTVMRQSLTRRKRQKVRVARERAGATIEIMFRRDFDRLARRWGLTALANAGGADNGVSADPRPGTETPGMGESVRTLGVGEDFRVDVDLDANVHVVTVGGDVDLHSAPVLRARLAELVDAGAAEIVLDLSEATFLDSMALGVILSAKRRVAAVGGRLELVVSTPEVRRIFEITMLDQVLDVHDTRADAIRGGSDRAR
jgi:anti-sigma B factor antagonist